MDYRIKGASTWRVGLPLWYDQRNSEYRGSIVQLNAGATYEIRLTLENGISELLQASTWSDSFPIAKSVELPESSHQTLQITESGVSSGYILYAPAPHKTATIDVGKSQDFNVIVTAKYIIIRGLALKGARDSAILLGASALANSSDVSNIVIENNDISEWGTNDPACVGKPIVHGIDLQAAVYSYSDRVQRITIQRNKLRDPSTGANSWEEPNCSGTGGKHPLGPQAISIRNSLGNLVIRYNEIYSTNGHYFNDAMGEPNNFSDKGFPNRDSDIYGNLIRNSWDDGIESEGADKNVRIWGNYIDQVMIPFGLAPVYRGPLYIWENLSYVSRTGPTKNYGQDFIKSRSYHNSGATNYGGGRVYIFNNTSLIPRNGSSTSHFLREFDKANRLSNYRTLNNIMNVNNPKRDYSIKDTFGVDNIFDFDLLEGLTAFSDIPLQQEVHGVRGSPSFVSDWGLDETTKVGKFSLAPSSAGYDQGTVIPNFMDNFIGSAPDMGAHESHTPPLEFGVNAYRKASP